MGKEINYSIIIPHKNIPELLQRCLNSIPRRDDIQIIIVDDNSDPNKVDFERFPGLGNPCVEIIFTKEGKGAGYARNVGLTKVVGKWLLFADADDYFTDGFLDGLDKHKNSSYDLIYFGINGVNMKKKHENSSSLKYNRLMKDAIYKKKYDEYKYTVYVPWGKMIKLSLIKENGIIFDETMLVNDLMFSIKTAYYAKNIFFDEYRIYTYEIRPYSLTSIWTLETKFVRFCAYIRLHVFLKSISKKRLRKNLILPLWRLIDIHNMVYFHKGMELIKHNNINLFIEFIEYLLVMPYQVIIKIRNLLLDRVCRV
jgi:glycosyltransferase involved in cell wall biosynthesis